MKTLSLLKFVLFILISSISITGYSSTWVTQSVDISYDASMPNGVFIILSGYTVTGKAACSTFNGRMTLDLTTQFGKALYSRLLAMKMSNSTKTFTLSGDGTCSLFFNSENINAAWFQ